MERYPQVIFMQRAAKKILLLLLAISILTPFFFLGTDYFEKQLAFFSSIITAWVTINPLEIEISAPAEVETGKVFKVEARAINKGEEKIENAKGEIFLPSGLVLLKKDSVQEIGVIPGKKEKKVSWSVRGVEAGSYIITVSVSGELRGELISAEDSVKLDVRKSASLGQGRRLDFFQRFLDAFRERFSY